MLTRKAPSGAGDMAGVDWRSDLNDHRQPISDSGIRPELPAAWPHVDAELIGAAACLASSEAAIQDLHTRYGDDADSREDYQQMEEERRSALVCWLKSRLAHSAECSPRQRR
jgi:hypothetical protein